MPVTLRVRDFMKEFLLNYYTIITNAVELLAALAAIKYLLKNRDSTSRFFVYYLVLTVIIENVALYSRFMQNNFDNNLFNLIKNSPICRNFWLYNIYHLFVIIFLGKYYGLLLKKPKYKRIISLLVVVYSIFSVFYFIFSDTFFYGGISYGMMLQTFIIVIFVCLYYLELLKSDKILKFHRSKHFYISVVLLLWFLINTPLFIFSDYYRLANPNFIYFRQLILLCSNIVMYLCFTIVFLYSFFKTK